MVELSTTYSPATLLLSQEAHSKSPANRYETVTKARGINPHQMGEPAPFFLLSLALADPEQSAKG
jgi:hypothetical protein